MTDVTVDVISAVEQACLAGADTSLHAGGFVPAPQVHMLIDAWDQPYVGYVRTRPYRQGVDAVRAIARLGDPQPEPSRRICPSGSLGPTA